MSILYQLTDKDMVITRSIDQYIIQKRDDANLSVKGFVKKFKEDYPEYPQSYSRTLEQELVNNEKWSVLFQDLIPDREHAKRAAGLEPNRASQRSVKSGESLIGKVTSCLGKTIDELKQLGFRVAAYIEEPPLVGAALQITANSLGVTDTCDSRECYFDHGRIRTDYWWDASGINVKWQAYLSEPSTIYVLLRDEGGVVISQLLLGQKVEGERIFTREFIGFDPSQTKWSLSFILI